MAAMVDAEIPLEDGSPILDVNAGIFCWDASKLGGRIEPLKECRKYPSL